MARKKRKGGPNLVAEALRSQSTGSNSNLKCKMNSRRGNYSGGSSSKTTESAIMPYDAAASMTRLQQKGFHKKVSNASVRSELAQWYATRDDSDEYRNGNLPSFGRYADGKELVKTVDVAILQEHQIQYPIRGVFAGLHIFGQILAENLASSGILNLVNFAKAYPEGWGGLSQGMAVFDISIRAFRGLPSGHVFVVVTPKVSHGKFLQNPDFDQDQERIAMRNVTRTITDIHRNCGSATPFWAQAPDAPIQVRLALMDMAEFDKMTDEEQDEYLRVVEREASNMWHPQVHGRKLVEMIKSLPHTEDVADRVARLTEPAPWEEHRMSRQVGLSTTFTSLIGIWNRRRTIRVLHFHGTPLLDRRLIAIVARACPNLKMLGIYDCPDVHFGDVICLLDLIHEINSSRSPGQPRIQALDFYPRYNTGSTLEQAKPGDDANAYGLSFKKLRSDAQQRGVFAILLQAVLKSKEMNIQLLMDRDGAFMTYLSKLPLLPLQVFSFLDGLYRYLDLMASRSTDKNAVKQALYDILKPVRMGLESMENDWHHFYLNEMGESMMFCSSCGYEYLEDFFAQSSRMARPHTRLCAGCTLRLWLDEESDAGKRDGLEIWDPFFPNWHRSEFNTDAPLHQHGNSLIRLRSTETNRPLPPLIQFDQNGNVIRPRHVEPLIRDNKIHNDSLRGLPTLLEMFDPVLLKEAQHRALVVDSRKAVDALLKDSFPRDNGGIKAYKDATRDSEGQGQARERRDMYLVSHNFDDAAVFFETLQDKKYSDLKQYRNANQYNPTGFW